MLEIDNVSGGYGRIKVLNGLSFSLGEGEFLGVLGHNGMGKTTLMRALMGFVPLSSGEIRLGSTVLNQLPVNARARLGIGYVPQGRQIFPKLTVRENLDIAAKANGRSPATVERVLEELPRLKPLLARAGGLLSGGEQQILALGRCLCSEPKIVLLDEPTEGVQPSIIEQMVDLLAALHRTRGLSTILVEQNLDFIRSLSQRIVVIEKGRITHTMGASSAGEVSELMAMMGFGPST
jgi:ABC-type branched-subunit amino acid transport system ATPase component